MSRLKLTYFGHISQIQHYRLPLGKSIMLRKVEGKGSGLPVARGTVSITATMRTLLEDLRDQVGERSSRKKTLIDMMAKNGST